MAHKLLILACLCFSFAVILTRNIYLTSLLSLLVTTIALLIKTSHNLLDRIKPLLVISLMVIVFQLLFNYSQTVESRLITGLLTAEKIYLLSLTVFLFTALVSLSKLIELLSFLPQQVRLMLTITFSLIPVIISEADRIILVQSSRGHNFRNINLFRSFLPIIIPLLHRSLRRAEQIATVLITRGYPDTNPD